MPTILKMIRKRQGKDVIDVVEDLKQANPTLDQAWYYRVENGKRGVSPEMAAQIAALFDVPLTLICNPSWYIMAAPEQDAGTPSLQKVS